MQQIRNLIIVHKNPLNNLSKRIKNMRRGAKTKGEGQVNVELIAPPNAQQVTVRRMNGYLTIIPQAGMGY